MPHASRTGRPLGQHLDHRELRDACALKGTPLLCPHGSQSLLAIKPFLLDCCRGTGEHVLVFAVDGIAFDVGAAVWSPDLLVPITSTFPSTSSTAWVTAMTGLSPDEHLVPGVVYYDPDHSSLYNCLSDCCLSADGEWRTAGWREARSYPTIFTDLSSEGVERVANAGDLVSLPGRWPRALLAGARMNASGADPDAIRMDPRAVVDAAVADTERALGQQPKGTRLFLWTYVNLDEYVHYHGYDAVLVESMRCLEAAARDWSRRGHTVVAHSDHGLVPNWSDEALCAAWQAVNRTELCRYPPGGAGRALWCYPRPDREQEVFDRVCAVMGDHALVLFRKELESRGVLSIGPALETMIGEVVVLATGATFPVAGSRPFEHGSLLPGEMLATLAVWASDHSGF